MTIGPPGPVLQEQARPGDAAGLHAAADRLLPAAVRHGGHLPAAGGAGEDPVLPRPARAQPGPAGQPGRTPRPAYPAPSVPVRPSSPPVMAGWPDGRPGDVTGGTYGPDGDRSPGVT